MNDGNEINAILFDPGQQPIENPTIRTDVADDLLNTNTLQLEIVDGQSDLKNRVIMDSEVNGRQWATRTTFLNIDSRTRNTTLYPSPNDYKITLKYPFKNVKKISLVSTVFPRSENVVLNYPIANKNNKIYWRLKEGYKDETIDDDDVTDDNIYAVEIPAGNYTANELTNAIGDAVDGIWDTLKEKYQEFDVVLNEDRDLVSFTSYETYPITNGMILQMYHGEYGVSGGSTLERYSPEVLSITTNDRGTVTLTENGDLVTVRMANDLFTDNDLWQGFFTLSDKSVRTAVSPFGVTGTESLLNIKIPTIRSYWDDNDFRNASGNFRVGWPRRVKFLWGDHDDNIATLIDFTNNNTDYLYHHDNATDIVNYTIGSQMFPFYHLGDTAETPIHFLSPSDIIIEHREFEEGQIADGDFVYLPDYTSGTCEGAPLGLENNGYVNMIGSDNRGYKVRTFYNQSLRNYLDGVTGAGGDFVSYWNNNSQPISQGTTGETASLLLGVTFSNWDDYSKTHFYISLDDTRKFHSSEIGDEFDGSDCGQVQIRQNTIFDLIGDTFIYLTSPQLNTMENNTISNVFAKIQLSGSVGDTIYDTFTTLPKTYIETPLNELRELEFKFKKDSSNDDLLYEFLGKEHSFTLEIVEYIDYSEGNMGFDTIRGTFDRTKYI